MNTAKQEVIFDFNNGADINIGNEYNEIALNLLIRSKSAALEKLEEEEDISLMFKNMFSNMLPEAVLEAKKAIVARKMFTTYESVLCVVKEFTNELSTSKLIYSLDNISYQVPKKCWVEHAVSHMINTSPRDEEDIATLLYNQLVNTDRGIDTILMTIF